MSTRPGVNRRHDESYRRARLKRGINDSGARKRGTRSQPVGSESKTAAPVWSDPLVVSRPRLLAWALKFCFFRLNRSIYGLISGLLAILLKSLSSGIRRSGCREVDRGLFSSSPNLPLFPILTSSFPGASPAQPTPYQQLSLFAITFPTTPLGLSFVRRYPETGCLDH